MKKESFEEQIQELSVNELDDMQKDLSIQLVRANNAVVIDYDLVQELKEKVLAIKNRITALRIRS